MSQLMPRIRVGISLRPPVRLLGFFIYSPAYTVDVNGTAVSGKQAEVDRRRGRDMADNRQGEQWRIKGTADRYWSA